MPLKLATILAHPDDETFGTGGTLIRYAKDGIEVHSLCLTQGEKGWAGVDDHIVPRELVGPTRAKELAEAGLRMGLTSVTCLRYPDSGLADVKEEWVVRDIVRWLRRVRGCQRSSGRRRSSASTRSRAALRSRRICSQACAPADMAGGPLDARLRWIAGTRC